MNIDLHIHTTASDGHLSPSEMVNRSAELGMTTIAITDHDSIEGVEEAMAAAVQFPQLRVIPGVEMGADVPDGEMHVLGYFVDCRSGEFCTELDKLRNSRTARGQQMVTKLTDLGIKLDWKQVEKLADGASIGRPHIAQGLLDQGYISTIQEAFDKYIGDNGSAYVERKKLGPLETVGLISKTGGLPVLAHPADTEDLESMVQELKQAGLVGIEVYYKQYRHNTINRLKAVADKYGLICTGGSDYHGFEDSGNEIGRCDVPQNSVDRLVDLCSRRKK